MRDEDDGHAARSRQLGAQSIEMREPLVQVRRPDARPGPELNDRTRRGAQRLGDGGFDMGHEPLPGRAHEELVVLGHAGKPGVVHGGLPRRAGAAGTKRWALMRPGNPLRCRG